MYFNIQSYFISINTGLIAEEIGGNKRSLVISHEALTLKERRLNSHVSRLQIYFSCSVMALLISVEVYLINACTK